MEALVCWGQLCGSSVSQAAGALGPMRDAQQGPAAGKSSSEGQLRSARGFLAFAAALHVRP
jgi:hypothetical protein